MEAVDIVEIQEVDPFLLFSDQRERLHQSARS